MSKPSRRPNRRHRHDRLDASRLPWRVALVGRHVGQYCTHPNCADDHEELPPGVDPFADFAYTVGLFDAFGLPEIHLPAYPDSDDKPLKPEVLGTTMNWLAQGLVTRNLAPGGETRFALCEHQTVVFTLGQPGPLDAVSAFQCSDGAECIPARWRIEGEHDMDKL